MEWSGEIRSDHTLRMHENCTNTNGTGNGRITVEPRGEERIGITQTTGTAGTGNHAR